MRIAQLLVMQFHIFYIVMQIKLILNINIKIKFLKKN